MTLIPAIARRSFFITGTDTGVGKTFFSCALLHAAANAGFTTAAIKPVAAGAAETSEGLRNDDALALQAACTLPLSYNEVNPFCLPAPLSPHLAAAEAGRMLWRRGLPVVEIERVFRRHHRVVTRLRRLDPADDGGGHGDAGADRGAVCAQNAGDCRIARCGPACTAHTRRGARHAL